jgi:hypothetical protein
MKFKELNFVVIIIVSDGSADVVDVVFVIMKLDLWGALEWVKEQGKNS